jgi:hypothetical protein
MHPNNRDVRSTSATQSAAGIFSDDMRIGKEQDQKSFAGTFLISYSPLNENEVFVRACGRARPGARSPLYRTYHHSAYEISL